MGLGKLYGASLFALKLAFAALYLGARADEVLDRINWAYVSSDTSSVEELENRFFGLLADADRLLESHPILRLQRWEEMAKSLKPGYQRDPDIEAALLNRSVL